jgi:hypothetical protein
MESNEKYKRELAFYQEQLKKLEALNYTENEGGFDHLRFSHGRGQGNDENNDILGMLNSGGGL